MADVENQSDCDESDNSDEDYVPSGKAGNVSEEEHSGEEESDLEEQTDGPKSKRRRKSNAVEEKTVQPVVEPSKLDVDSIWADFKKDAEAEEKRITSDRKIAVVKPPPPQVNPTCSKIPAVSTSQPKPPGGGGLASILGKLGKKDKMSTLEKSKLDWNNFKQAEGIDEDLKKHNKGRDGFLERRDFLERTDLRQFELEKQMRAVKRSSR